MNCTADYVLRFFDITREYCRVSYCFYDTVPATAGHRTAAGRRCPDGVQVDQVAGAAGLHRFGFRDNRNRALGQSGRVPFTGGA